MEKNIGGKGLKLIEDDDETEGGDDGDVRVDNVTPDLERLVEDGQLWLLPRQGTSPQKVN